MIASKPPDPSGRASVGGRNVVSTYEIHLDGALISVSVATVQLTPDGRTRLTYTEQGVLLDGLDQASIREHGTGELLDALGTHLQRESGVTSAGAC